MKILHVADLHIGRYFNGVSLLEDQREMLQDILRIIKEQNPDVVLIAGDLYDRSIPREDAVKLNDYFLTELVRLGKKNLVITGNHDSHERVGFLSSLLEDKGLIVENTVRRPLRCITLKDEFGPVENLQRKQKGELKQKGPCLSWICGRKCERRNGRV